MSEEQRKRPVDFKRGHGKQDTYAVELSVELWQAGHLGAECEHTLMEVLLACTMMESAIPKRYDCDIGLQDLRLIADNFNSLSRNSSRVWRCVVRHDIVIENSECFHSNEAEVNSNDLATK